MEVKSGVTQGIAMTYEGARIDGSGLVFKVEPHPDRLNYTIAHWDAIESACKAWDQESDMNIHFTSGDKLLIPADIFGKVYMEWFYRQRGIMPFTPS